MQTIINPLVVSVGPTNEATITPVPMTHHGGGIKKAVAVVAMVAIPIAAPAIASSIAASGVLGAAISGARHVYRYSEKVAPLQRNPDLKQVGNAALYLLSDISSGVTGLTHYVDGGLKVIGIPDQDLVNI